MTRAEFDEICYVTCPHCRASATVAQRQDTGEWVHTMGKGGISHSICWASGFRNSRFAENLTEGTSDVDSGAVPAG